MTTPVTNLTTGEGQVYGTLDVARSSLQTRVRQAWGHIGLNRPSRNQSGAKVPRPRSGVKCCRNLTGS
jgi:hypothetical protein